MSVRDGVHVVVGTGAVGRALIRALGERGLVVRAVNRSGASPLPGVEVVRADVADPDAARRATRDAAVVYGCAAPPYERPDLLAPLTDGLLAGAEAAGAPLVMMDNLYAYGPTRGRPLTEDLPAAASGPKGRARARMAAVLMAAHAEGRVPTAIGRASDFIGPHADSVLGDRAVEAVAGGGAVGVLGDPDLLHTYTYVPDVAEALVILGERPEALGHVWHLPSPETRTTREVVGLMAAAAGRPGAKVRPAGRALLAVAGIFSTQMRELREVLYQFRQPWVVDHSRFTDAFGGAPTPLAEAVAATVADWRARGSGG